jgi:hypothetical protein
MKYSLGSLSVCVVVLISTHYAVQTCTIHLNREEGSITIVIISYLTMSSLFPFPPDSLIYSLQSLTVESNRLHGENVTLHHENAVRAKCKLYNIHTL